MNTFLNKQANEIPAELEEGTVPQAKQAPTPLREQNEEAETLSDDFDLPEEVVRKITDNEDVVREVLALFDVNYDDVIRMDGKSPYAQAVQQNPAVLEHVKAAPNPVLEALKIAMQFKPYSDFTQKYGTTPEDVRMRIRQEMEDELKAQAGQAAAHAKAPAGKSVAGTPFSHKTSTGRDAKKEMNIKELNSFFK